MDQEEVEEECLDHQTCINVNRASGLISLPPNVNRTCRNVIKLVYQQTLISGKTSTIKHYNSVNRTCKMY